MRLAESGVGWERVMAVSSSGRGQVGGWEPIMAVGWSGWANQGQVDGGRVTGLRSTANQGLTRRPHLPIKDVNMLQDLRHMLGLWTQGYEWSSLWMTMRPSRSTARQRQSTGKSSFGGSSSAGSSSFAAVPAASSRSWLSRHAAWMVW